MMKIAKNKLFTGFIAMTTIVWAMGLAGVLTPLFPAQAGVTVTSEFMIPPNMNAYGGFMSSVAALKITGTAGEQLKSIKVRFDGLYGTPDPALVLAPFNEAAAAGSDDQGLCIYKDGNGNGWMDPGSGDSVLVWETKPSWTNNGDGTYDVTLDVVDDTLPTSYSAGSGNYFLHMKMHDTPPSGKSFRFTFLGGASGTVVTSGTSPTITQVSTDTINSAGGGGDGDTYMSPPRVDGLYYGSYRDLIIDFNMPVTADSVECDEEVTPGSCARYTLMTGANDNQSIIRATRDGSDPSRVSVVAHAGARISMTMTDSLQISTNPSIAPKSVANGMPYSDPAPLFWMWPNTSILISEIQLAGAAATDEFIELYNIGLSPQSIAGWKVAVLTDLPGIEGVDNTYTVLATIAGGTTMAQGGYYLLANDANSFDQSVDGQGLSADAAFTGVDLDSGNTIFLIDENNTVRDIVGVGHGVRVYQTSPFNPAPLANGSIERKAVYSSTSATMVTSDVAIGNGYNSNDNMYDFVSRTLSDPQKSTSGVEVFQLGGETHLNTPPHVMHSPISTAVVSTEIKLLAEIYDVESTSQQITTTLCYKAGTAGWPGSCVSGSSSGSSTIFTIPASAVTAAGIDYYIKAVDGMSEEGYSAADPVANTEVLAQAMPYHINVSTTSGARKISGRVYQSDCVTGIDGATVRIEGTGISAVTSIVSDQAGTFTLNGVFDGVWNLSANAGGYHESTIWGVGVSSNNPQSTGWQFCLDSGVGAHGGDSSAPMVIETTPSDGMNSAPIDIVIDRAPIFIRFNKPMNVGKLTTSNILLKKMNNFTGQVEPVTNYAVTIDTGLGASNRGATFYAPGASVSTPVAVIDMVEPLVKNTQYIVEILPAVIDMAGNSVQGGRPGGGHSFTFTTQSTDMNFSGSSGFGFTEDAAYYDAGNFGSMTDNADYMTMADNFNTTTGQWSGGDYSPFFVKGAQPSSGAWSVSKNLSKMMFEFSESLDSSSVNTGTFKLFQKSGNSFTDVTSTYISSVTTSNDKLFAIMNLSSNLMAGEYEIRVKAGIRASSGVTLGNPNDPGANQFMVNFTVADVTDSTAPGINGSWPDNNATGVPLDFGFVDIGFNESLEPGNVNTATVTLKTGTSTIPAVVKYDSMSQSIKVIPTTGLTPGMKYTLTITLGGTSGIKDLYGNPSGATTLTRSFTMTSTFDTTKPRVEVANCDGYQCAVTFSRPMSALKQSDASSNASLWTGSVLKSGNYALTFGADGTGSTENLGAAGVSFDYDYETNTVKIKGLSFTGATKETDQFIITVSNVMDLSNNPIDATANSAKGVLRDEAKTGGMIGPACGGLSGPSAMGGAMMTGAPTGFGGFSEKDAMMMGGVGAMPMNMMAGATTTYMIDFPIPPSGKSANALDDGAYIKLTFPKGVNIVSAIPDPYNPNKNDLNMSGPSIVKFKTSGVADDGAGAATKGGAASDGVTVSGQTMTLWLNTNGGQTGDPDYFHFEVKNIVNPTKVQDFNSNGYTVDMKAYKADGTNVSSMTSMPFFINAAGANNITATIAAESGTGTFQLMMGSPMTGPLDATVNIANGTGTQTWSNLPDGCYNIFSEPTVTLGANKYSGQMNPEPICVPGSGENWNSGTKTLTRALTFAKFSASNSASLTVKVSGTFSADGEDLDIFAGGPNSFAVNTTTLTGAVTNNSSTLYFPSNGIYMVGIGPAMPKGPMMGPPPMPDWMPPTNVQVEVSGIGGTPIIKRNDTNATITELSFNINSASKEILGCVVSKETTLGANYTSSATSLTLASGTGFNANDSIVVTDGTNTKNDKILSISGATVQLVNGMNQAFSSGAKVYNVMQNVEIWASQPMGFGGMGSHTQSLADGSFVLKVAANGNYEIGAHKPGIGEAPFRSVAVKDNTVGVSDGNTTCDVNLEGDYVTTAAPFLIKMYKADYMISGKVMDLSGNPLNYTSVMANETTTHQSAQTMSDSDGDYMLNVGDGTWTVTAQMPSGTDTCGTITKAITVSGANKPTENLQPTSSTCYTISGSVSIGGTAQGSVPIMVEAWDTVNDWPSGGYHRNESTANDGSYSIKAGNGTYRVSMWSPDYGELGQNVTVNGGNQTVNISYDLASLKTLTVAFTGGTSNMRGFIEVKEIAGSATTNSRGAVRRGMPLPDLSQSQTISVPAGTYRLMVFVDGMGDFSPSSTIDLSTSNQSTTVDLSAQTMRTVLGTVLDNSNNPIANAAVLLINETTGLVKQTTTDASGDYSMSVKEGTYSIKAEHKDYGTPAKYSNLEVTGNVNFDFDGNTTDEDIQIDNDLVEKGNSISGTIYESDGSTPMNLGGFVYATEATTGAKAKGSIQQDGSYQLSVTDGTWSVIADGPLHAETTRSATVAVSGSSLSNKDITLTSDPTDIKSVDSRTIVPTSGVVVNDANNTGLEISAGTGVIGGQNSSGTLTFQQVDLPALDTTLPLVGTEVEITAKAGGEDVNQLNGEGAEIILHYTAAELTSAGVTDESLLTLSYYDDTTDSFMPLDNQTCNTTENYCMGKITHLTSVSITHPPLVAASATTTRRAVDTTGGAAATTTTTTIIEPTTTTTTTTDEAVTTTVEEITTVVKTEVKEVSKEVASEVVTLTNVVPVKPAARELKKEIQGVKDYAKLVGKSPATANEWRVVDFLTYGTTDKVKKMAERERVGLLEDYKAVYNHIPSTDSDWESVAKMAEGTTPARIIGREAEALKAFVKVFGRLVDFSKPAEEKFIHSVAYYLRPEARELAKEKTALATFSKSFKQMPNTGFMWSVLRGIAYAGVSMTAPAPAPVETVPAAPVVEAPKDNAVPALPVSADRDLKNEITAVNDYIALAGQSPDAEGWNVVTFISYGSTAASKAKTSVERLQAVKDFKTANGKFPSTEADWMAVVK